MEIKDIVKNHDLKEIVVKFDCGGDQINVLEVESPDYLSEEEKDTILSEVENNVTFYESSSDSYIGEYGVVKITLDEEGEVLFDKISTSLIIEREHFNLKIQVTPEETEYLRNVRRISSDVYNGDYTEIEFSYKKDIVVNDKIEKSLKTKIAEEAYEKLQDVNDEYILASGCVSISTDEIEIEDGELIIGCFFDYETEQQDY